MTTEGTVQLVKILVYSPILSHCLCALFGQMESALTQPMSPCGRQSRQFSPWIRSFSEKNTHFRGGFLWGPGSSNKNSPKHTALIAPFRPLQKAPVAGRCGLERRGDDHRRRWNQPPSNGRCSSDVPLEIRGRVPSPLIEITKRERTKQKLFLYIIYHPYIYMYIYILYIIYFITSVFSIKIMRCWCFQSPGSAAPFLGISKGPPFQWWAQLRLRRYGHNFISVNQFLRIHTFQKMTQPFWIINSYQDLDLRKKSHPPNLPKLASYGHGSSPIFGNAHGSAMAPPWRRHA